MSHHGVASGAAPPRKGRKSVAGGASHRTAGRRTSSPVRGGRRPVVGLCRPSGAAAAWFTPTGGLRRRLQTAASPRLGFKVDLTRRAAHYRLGHLVDIGLAPPILPLVSSPIRSAYEPAIPHHQHRAVVW